MPSAVPERPARLSAAAIDAEQTESPDLARPAAILRARKEERMTRTSENKIDDSQSLKKIARTRGTVQKDHRPTLGDVTNHFDRLPPDGSRLVSGEMVEEHLLMLYPTREQLRSECLHMKKSEAFSMKLKQVLKIFFASVELAPRPWQTSVPRCRPIERSLRIFRVTAQCLIWPTLNKFTSSTSFQLLMSCVMDGTMAMNHFI